MQKEEKGPNSTFACRLEQSKDEFQVSLQIGAIQKKNWFQPKFHNLGSTIILIRLAHYIDDRPPPFFFFHSHFLVALVALHLDLTINKGHYAIIYSNYLSLKIYTFFPSLMNFVGTKKFEICKLPLIVIITKNLSRL